MKPREAYTVNQLGRMRGALTVSRWVTVLNETPFVSADRAGYRRKIGTIDVRRIPGIKKSVDRQRKATEQLTKRQQLVWLLLPLDGIVVHGVCFDKTFVVRRRGNVAQADPDDLRYCDVARFIELGLLRVAAKDKFAEYITS